MLRINNLQFERHDTFIFAPINLTVQAAQCVQLCGANGSGKTTLLKVLMGLLRPRRGSFFYHDQKITSFEKQATFVGHELALKPMLTVAQNLEYYTELMEASPIDLKTACDFFDLTGFYHQTVSSLSSGQKQRCKLAKLLIAPRSLWLLDEPFTALDAVYAARLLVLFEDFLKRQGAIIFTTHQAVSTTQFSIIPFHLDSV